MGVDVRLREIMGLKAPGFFIDGEASDLAYVTIRDDPRGIGCKAFVESLWTRFCTHADSHFREDARNHFHQRFWEMYLGVTLLDRGIMISKHGEDGPEFFAKIHGQRVWFEAVAPSGGTGPDQVPDLVPSQARRVPVDQILLRFTSALAEKKKQYLAAIAKGVIAPEDPYVLAINSRGIPSAPYGNTMPYFLQALLPIGPLAVGINRDPLEVTDSFYQYRPHVTKASGAEVSTRTFLDQDAAFCSAVIHSAVDCANHPPNLGGDFSVLHNPNAAHPITESAFPWCTQFSVHNDELHRSQPNPTIDADRLPAG